jgi:branched-subunit amino acid transport protein
MCILITVVLLDFNITFLCKISPIRVNDKISDLLKRGTEFSSVGLLHALDIGVLLRTDNAL